MALHGAVESSVQTEWCGMVYKQFDSMKATLNW